MKVMRKENTCFYKFVVTLVVLFIFCFSSNGKEVTLKSGTQIPLELQGTVSSKNVSNGSLINFRCIKDIVVNEGVVIRAGELAKGQVTRIKKNGILGRAGEIEIKVISIAAVDGTDVYLSSSSLYDDGKDKLLLSLFLCFLIKGGDGEIPAGTSCLANVAGNTVVSVN